MYRVHTDSATEKKPGHKRFTHHHTIGEAEQAADKAARESSDGYAVLEVKTPLQEDWDYQAIYKRKEKEEQ